MLGPLSNCSLADVKMRPGVVMLTTTNFGFKDMTLNMLESIKRTGVCVNTTIIAEDQKCYRYLSQRAEGDPAVHVVLTNSGETTSKEIPRRQRKQYYALFNKRQEYFLGLLEQGYEVLFTDSDTFWFSDPFPYFKGDFDMSMIDPRSPYPTRTNRSHYCAGFAYFKPTNVTVRFVKAWIKTMRDNDKIGRLLADQDVMNMLLRGDRPMHVNVQPLDTNIFPWGPKFYELLAKKANYSTVVMHAASIRGYAAKVTKFKSSNMWLVKTESSDFFQLYLNGLTLLITVFISSLGIGCCCCYCCFYRCFMYNEDGPTAKEGHGKP
ncbi:UDP-D-xylose:L-fucose alpha-1,3-D-xylosyltransferase MGP4-like isoform X2 [Acanthaster planci]|uniref:UDP-D-xylose:L-fucose alpha-1,3-D-xylosyltransferase MGP4-like isoform X2 n=1 Tax=Acanthaster planci TaxID=133434 RepID=A0A8B7XFK8_ACAPL|nr:UDP-D-xylose:L-fucose alpha-1,3-D-xylosyltransferase MGP4-like isoform X2 [Acanthaster planci]